MERIEGRVLWSFMFRPEAKNTQQLSKQFCGLLLQLHRLDWQSVAEDSFHYDEKNSYQFVDRWMHRVQEHLVRFGLSSFDPILDWLHERRDAVPCAQPAVIHNDLHPANVLVRDDGSAVVIDWSGCDISDARYDLAWTMLLAGAYESMEIAGNIIETYEQLAGNPVEQIAFFEVSACLRRLFRIVVSLRDKQASWGWIETP